MTISMYAASVPVFKQLLGALNEVLNKAAAHAAEKKFDPSIFLQARMIPDMFPLVRQVQLACNYAGGVPARLAGLPVPANDDKDQSIEDLQALIGRTLAFLEKVTPELVNGSETREVVLRPGTPKERKLDGQTYLLSYALPQFVFHVTTAYGLLRKSGVEIGKRDFMGNY